MMRVRVNFKKIKIQLIQSHTVRKIKVYKLF